MTRMQCPSCRMHAISLWDFLTTSYCAEITCPNCYIRSIKPVDMIWCDLPSIGGMLAAYWYGGSTAVSIAIIAAACMFSTLLAYRFVRLVVV